MIAKFFRNIKMKMLLAQTKLEITNRSNVEKAYILLMWAEFILELHDDLPDSQVYLEVLLEPEKFSEVVCYQAYWNLESLKMYADQSLKQNKKNMREWGMSSPEFDSMKLRYCSILRGLAVLAGSIDLNQKSKSQDIKNMFNMLVEKDFDEAVSIYQESIDFSMTVSSKMKIEEKINPTPMQDLKKIAISFV